MNSPTKLGGSEPPADPAGAAERAWALLHGFAEAHNRHGDLAEALGFRLGAGAERCSSGSVKAR
ncbi:hypothetical protein GXW82_16940 [Streptacidiphilus sp. 4-A2]|nr:hypothetical protein [Streptacidiphilus sp. 4-A2]